MFSLNLIVQRKSVRKRQFTVLCHITAYSQPPASPWPLREALGHLNHNSCQYISPPSLPLDKEYNQAKAHAPLQNTKRLSGRSHRCPLLIHLSQLEHMPTACNQVSAQSIAQDHEHVCSMLPALTWRDLRSTGKDFPCGNFNSTDPVVPCCIKRDICLTNGICSYQKSLIGASGYYVAGCTASSGLCPGFPNRCTSHVLPDVTWNSTSGP